MYGIQRPNVNCFAVTNKQLFIEDYVALREHMKPEVAARASRGLWQICPLRHATRHREFARLDTCVLLIRMISSGMICNVSYTAGHHLKDPTCSPATAASCPPTIRFRRKINGHAPRTRLPILVETRRALSPTDQPDQRARRRRRRCRTCSSPPRSSHLPTPRTPPGRVTRPIGIRCCFAPRHKHALSSS
jgi:hypothetical protein